jgi:hypothetical protein
MGFAQASSSFVRFRILDPVPQALWEQLSDRLRQFAFKDIDDTLDMSSAGWVNFDNMLDTDWSETPPQKADYILFSLRLDRRRIPAGVIAKHLTLALNAEKDQIRLQNKKFIPRERKKEIKEQVLLRLRGHFLPIPAIFDVLWLTRKNEIWFASTHENMIDLFLEEFLKTFELHLELMTPYNLATTVLPESSLPLLDHLEATRFAALKQ